METQKDSTQMAQSASALGAGLLGFGLGILFGEKLRGYGLIVVAVGAGIHLYGMYGLHFHPDPQTRTRIARIIWLTAWLCFISLLVLMVYLLRK